MVKNIRDWYYYTQGYIRYALYYSKFAFLIPQHIKEQIEYRIAVMDKECYELGSCKICGCATIALQMANKQCPKPCYPSMMKYKEWKDFKKRNGYD